MKSNKTKIEIFCGTGGVGKTTVATSRAFFLGSKGKKVLLITIDPAKRLKQILNLSDDDAGSKHQVKLNEGNEETIDAVLMSPTHTYKKMNLISEKPNKILEILMRPNGGMNEIMAIIEVQSQLKSGKYDVIVLDTPPGKHFLDFLKATQKIDRFFDKSFIEIFKYFGKKVNKNKISLAPKKVIGLVVSTGLKKLLKYLEIVTGKEFVEEFVDAIFILFKNKEKFLTALAFQKHLENELDYELFLVASTEQQKLNEVLDIQRNSHYFSSKSTSVLVNKSIRNRLKLEEGRPLSEQDHEIVAYFKKLETEVNEFSDQYFGSFKVFEESLASSPRVQVVDLVKDWKQYDI